MPDKYLLRSGKDDKRYWRAWKRVTAVLSVAVVISTVTSLMMPAITMSPATCEIAQHQHTDTCYSKETEQVITCEYQEDDSEDISHVHGDACYTYDDESEQSVLSCTETEAEAHEHTEACYTEIEKEVLICQIPEHSHSSECQEQQEVCNCGTEDETHGESCPLYAAPECNCGTESEAHGETCPLYAAPECNCGTESEAHGEICPLYAAPECNCGTENEVHGETCPLYAAPKCICGTEDENHAVKCPMYIGSPLFAWAKEAVTVEELYDTLLEASQEELLLLNTDELIHIVVQAKSLPYDDVENKEELFSVLQILVYMEGSCEICTANDGGHNDGCVFGTVSSANDTITVQPLLVDPDTGIHSEKTLIGADTDDLMIQLEAWTDGIVRTAPVDVVLLLDHSGSMYRAADGDEPNNTNIAMTYTGFINGGGDTAKGAKEGYYVAITKQSSVAGVWNWNNETSIWTQYAVSLIRYNQNAEGGPRWEHSAQIQCQTAGKDVNLQNWQKSLLLKKVILFKIRVLKPQLPPQLSLRTLTLVTILLTLPLALFVLWTPPIKPL